VALSLGLPHPRRFLQALVVLFILIQGIAFMPTPLERPFAVAQVDPEELKPKQNEAVLAPGVPKDQIPDYTVEDFEYISTQGNQKQWRLVAKKANMFNNLRVVHAQQIVAYLFNPGSEPTVVTGKEAKYFVDDRDLEVFGDVVSKFPDGFSTRSEYLRYQPKDRLIRIPEKYAVHGESTGEESDQTLDFDSLGMIYPMKENEVLLPRSVRAIMKQGQKKTESNKGVEDETEIRSDRCVMNRNKNIAYFTMYPTRPVAERFVRITQPDLFAKSRKADLHYGNFSDVVHYMTAREDVLLQEVDPDTQELRYATGGRADFDSRKKLVILSEFPQVYQDSDTLVGDVILMHRDTGIVEVEHGNAFNAGKD
jgi:LPS export ABC transporter protein LptC